MPAGAGLDAVLRDTRYPGKLEQGPFPPDAALSQSLIAKLNPEQRAAVEATEGPLLILAGAGSGKTRVITSRIAWLIEEKGVAPDSILAVTFTNKAASEMAERVNKLLGHTSLAKPLIATFHSLCVRMLRRDIEALKVKGAGLTRSFAIYDENDQAAIVKQIMRRMGLDIKQLTPRTVLGRISWAKNHMVDPQDYYLGSKDPNGERIAHIYKEYTAELRKNNAMDFDDLLLEAVRLLKVSAETRERYQRRYRYVLVDEYQDTNRPQYELMKLLAGEHKNVCAVGDEDQSIYSWRGADIRNILEFEKDFPNARIVRLEQNYRSTQNILEAAGAVVSNNLRRKGKKLWTDRQGGSLIGYYEAPDGENEALFIADNIQKFLREARRLRRRGPLRGAVSHQLAIAPRRRSAAPLQHQVLHGGRIQLLRARRDQGRAGLSAPGAQSARFDGAAIASSTRRSAASAPPPWRRSNGWLSKPAVPPGTRSAPRSTTG